MTTPLLHRQSVRHSAQSVFTLLFSAAIAGTSLMLPASALAEAPAAATSADSIQQPYTGVLNEDNVYVRSGPGEVFYATTKLSKGAKVTVLATRNDWLKIVPPEGSFCYVARAYVEKRGDGTIGRVTKPDLNVRAGSTLNGLKTTVQTSLAEGDDVKILPDQIENEYFKIVPPPSAYLYIKKAFVDVAPDAPVAPVPVVAADKQHEPIASAPVPPVITPPANVAVPTPVAPPAAPPAVTAAPSAPAVPVPPVTVAAAPTTNPTASAAIEPVAVASTTQPAVAVVPATQPAELSSDVKFDQAEAEFLDATKQPLDKQPIAELLLKYNSLAADTTVPTSMRRIVDIRVQTLKLRGDAQKQYADALKMQADSKARQAALVAEKDELSQRIKDQAVTIYTALGTLRISSLQQSGTTLYRLTDPGSGRTLVYIKSNDPKYTGLLNQFIGVKGDITEDTNMNIKYVNPTAVDTVDAAKVNTTVTATVIPPSMLPKTSTASVVGN